MSVESDILDGLNKDIEASMESLKADLGRMRTGRASISLLDPVRVDYYGTPTPLAQCANLSAPDARTLNIKPYDSGLITAIEKAITKADLGLNPQNDGKLIRVPIPALNEERRKEIVKQAKSRGEDGKISVRNARRDANELLKQAEKDKEMSEDDLKRALVHVQERTDLGVKQVEELVAAKEKEILEV